MNMKFSIVVTDYDGEETAYEVYAKKEKEALEEVKATAPPFIAYRFVSEKIS